MKKSTLHFSSFSLSSIAIKSLASVRTFSVLLTALSVFASHSLYAQSLTEQLEQGLGLARSSDNPNADIKTVKRPKPTNALHQNTHKNLSDDVETLKQSMVNLNRDLFILEEDLLFPSSTQMAIYLSMDVGDYFGLDAVEIRVNGEVKTHYLYTDSQVDALFRGGIQRLFVGNVTQGDHELTAYFIGIGPEKREYKRAVSVKFTKDEEPVAVELSVTDSTKKQQPMFEATVL